MNPSTHKQLHGQHQLWLICCVVGVIPGILCNTESCNPPHVSRYSRRRSTRWRHQIETFSALLAIGAGNSPVTGEFPLQRPVTRSFDVLFDLRFNGLLSKQSWGWWFETSSRPLWRHCNDLHEYCDDFVDGHNYALLRPATQSSTYNHNTEARCAVDGIVDGDQSISHTRRGDHHPWWKVKLAYPIWVTHVEIVNRYNSGQELSFNWIDRKLLTFIMSMIWNMALLRIDLQHLCLYYTAASCLNDHILFLSNWIFNHSTLYTLCRATPPEFRDSGWKWWSGHRE